MRARSLRVLFLFVFTRGCESDPTPKQTGAAGVRDGGAADATTDGAIDAGSSSLCANVEPGGVGVASASFGVGRLKFEPLAALSGSAAAAIVESKNQGLGGLIAYPGGRVRCNAAHAEAAVERTTGREAHEEHVGVAAAQGSPDHEYTTIGIQMHAFGVFVVVGVVGRDLTRTSATSMRRALRLEALHHDETHGVTTRDVALSCAHMYARRKLMT